MIGEAFDGINWGGNLKAARAANRRALELDEEGYVTYSVPSTALGGNKTYYLFAFDKAEDQEIRPRNPETHPMGRRLNVRTAHVGMRVAVEHIQGEPIDGQHNLRGVIRSVSDLYKDNIQIAEVEFDGERAPRPVQVHRLRQVAQ